MAGRHWNRPAKPKPVYRPGAQHGHCTSCPQKFVAATTIELRQQLLEHWIAAHREAPEPCPPPAPKWNGNYPDRDEPKDEE